MLAWEDRTMAEDKRDRWTPMIDASHPLKVGTKDAHDAYATALEMVGNRHSKGALVDLVCWLVQRVDMAEDQLRQRRTAGVSVPSGEEVSRHTLMDPNKGGN